MAQILTVRLNRGDATPWGFRLQGGVDFGTPIALAKVNGGSLADNSGLVAGDTVLKVNGVEVYNLRHKDAQDLVVRAGNNVELTVQRGGCNSTWRPNVTPVGNMPQAGSGYSGPVTKTSLVANQQPIYQPPGTGYNTASKPYANGNGYQQPQQQQPDQGVKSIVNKQYNTPVGIYSEESIAETLSAQAEVLAGGVLGVNFKKNEKAYDSTNSEVFKMLQEAKNEPPEPEEPRSFSPRPQQQYQTNTNVNFGPPAHHHHVNAPVSAPVSAPVNRANTGGLPTGQNICAECERLIVGVFVRIKDKNLHVDCFRCATCGSSLKNQGYFNINNKLYCDVHAKLIAMKNPPPGTEGYIPVPIKPSSKLSANTISQALSQHHNIHVSGNPTIMAGAAAPVNSSAPKPYAYPPAAAPKSPSMASPRSPAYPPPQPAAPAWGGQQNNNYSSATLPRAHAPSHAPAGNYNTLTPFKYGGVQKRAPPIKKGGAGIMVGPKRGRGVMNKAVAPGGRIPLCGCCNTQIRGPFITALGRIWCPDHFVCVNGECRRQLADIGFVEEKGDLYCEYCFEKYIAPPCSKCHGKIKGDCLNAIGKQFHPECFTCSYCGKLFGNSPFFLEDGQPYCEADWNEMFTTKCFACGFPVEAGDRWVEALSHNYHSQCFNCTACKTNLEGQSFFAKNGRPFCKNHAR